MITIGFHVNLSYYVIAKSWDLFIKHFILDKKENKRSDQEK